MKHLTIVLISSLGLLFASLDACYAQRSNKSDNFEAKAASKASKKGVQIVSNNTPSSSPKAIYEHLTRRQYEINTTLQSLSASLPALKGGKAKKVVKQIDALQTENRAIATQIDMLPRAVRDPQYALEIEQQEKQAFRDQLKHESDELMKNVDPYAGQLSTDPELQQAYREYIAINIGNQQYNNTEDLTFRVMFAIAKKPLAKTSVKLAPVLTQKLNNGSTAYYFGNFKSKEEAQNACNKILAEGKYRDAFVVAMVGDKRVPMPR